jgi:Zn-finger nucleic acid-binding protein
MNCPNCSAPMHLDRDRLVFTCEYCLTVIFPQESGEGVRVLGEPTPFECPTCRRPLVLGAIERTEVSTCQNCRGLLLPQSAFFDTVRYLRARASQPPLDPPPTNLKELQRKIRCPRCHQPMDTHPYGGPGNIVIDTCPRCELLWLDHGELTRVIRARERKLSW